MRHFSLLPIITAAVLFTGFWVIRSVIRAIRHKVVISYGFIALLGGFTLFTTAIIYVFVAISLSALHGSPPEAAYIGWLLLLCLVILPVAGLLFFRVHQKNQFDHKKSGFRFKLFLVVFILLWLGVTAVVSGRLAMILALERNNTGTVDLLLNLGISANMKLMITGETHRPLHYAAYQGSLRMLRLLLDHGADVDAEKTLLFEAIIGGNPEVVKILLQKGADPNQDSGSGYSSPLMFAVANCDRELVRLLANSGADINFINYRDMTALDIAREKGFGEIVQLLLQLGAKEKISSPQRERALFSAVGDEDYQKMQRLLDKGTNINCLDGLHRTPLIHAAAYGKGGAVLWLFKHGARVGVRDVNGRNALAYAAEKNLTEVANLLSQKKE